MQLAGAVLAAIGMLAPDARAAEGVLKKVQRELRARKIYFGSIDGRASDETKAGIRKFQQIEGLEATGDLSGATFRALGMAGVPTEDPAEAAQLEACATCVLRFFEARAAGDWAREEALYAAAIDYYSDGMVAPDFIKADNAREDGRWPWRKFVLLNRIASLVPEHAGAALVTARVHKQVWSASGETRARTEDLQFRLRREGQNWRIASIQQLE